MVIFMKFWPKTCWHIPKDLWWILCLNLWHLQWVHENSGGRKIDRHGGRPSTSPIQGIGGTKGANNYPFAYIHQLTTLDISTGSADQIRAWTATTSYSDLAQNRSTETSVNVRDNILRGHLGDGVPAQFVYEAADCRLFLWAKYDHECNAHLEEGSRCGLGHRKVRCCKLTPYQWNSHN